MNIGHDKRVAESADLYKFHRFQFCEEAGSSSQTKRQNEDFGTDHRGARNGMAITRGKEKKNREETFSTVAPGQDA